MLRIYPVCLEMVRQVANLAIVVKQHDRDLCRQLQRSSASVVLNLAEGSAVRDGRRPVRYGDALGSALETRNLVVPSSPKREKGAEAECPDAPAKLAVRQDCALR
ncbi:MAG: four helix bundle protein [Kofleriaceae bacterium]|nr:four helix bundle protein [Kofleriaceae bacterium]